MVTRNSIELHDSLAATWSDKYRKFSFDSRGKIIQKKLEYWVPKCSKWLDAGCGTADLAIQIAALGGTVSAVDGSERMLEVASARIPDGLRPKIELIRVPTIEQLPFANSSFDGILCSSVFEYVDSPENTLKELKRVLSPRGVLLISVPNRQSCLRKALKFSYQMTLAWKRPWPKWVGYSRHEFSSNEFAARLADLGFEVLSYEYFGFPFRAIPANSFWTGSLILFEARIFLDVPSVD